MFSLLRRGLTLAGIDCQVFLPEIKMDKWKLTQDKDVPSEVQEEAGVQFKYEIYQRNVAV
jgi:hypothetical protein